MIAPLATLALALAALSALTVVRPAMVVAGPVPDPIQMALLRQSVADVRLIRVRGGFGTRWANRPELDSSGVRISEELAGPHSSMRLAVRADEVAPIPWQEISSLETDRASAGKSIMLGGLAGLLVGCVISLSYVDAASLQSVQHRADTALAVSTCSGLALGALVGLHGEKRTIYPPQSREHR